MVLITLMHYLISHNNTLIEVLLLSLILQMNKLRMQELSTVMGHLHLTSLNITGLQFILQTVEEQSKVI